MSKAAVSKDFKGEWNFDEITKISNSLMRKYGAKDKTWTGSYKRHNAHFIQVPSSGGDGDVLIISNVKLSKRQAQSLFNEGDVFITDRTWTGRSLDEIMHKISAVVP